MDRISLTLAWFVSPSPESILYAGSMRRPSTEAWTREECLTTIKYLLDGRINVIDNVYPVLPILASVGLLGKQTTATTTATMVVTYENYGNRKLNGDYNNDTHLHMSLGRRQPKVD